MPRIFSFAIVALAIVAIFAKVDAARRAYVCSGGQCSLVTIADPVYSVQETIAAQPLCRCGLACQCADIANVALQQVPKPPQAPTVKPVKTPQPEAPVMVAYAGSDFTGSCGGGYGGEEGGRFEGRPIRRVVFAPVRFVGRLLFGRRN